MIKLFKETHEDYLQDLNTERQKFLVNTAGSILGWKTLSDAEINWIAEEVIFNYYKDV